MTNIDYTPDLRAAQRRFADRTKGLSPRVLRLQLLALVNRAPGTGPGQVDPLEASFAKQSLDLLTAQDGLARVQQAHADLSARRGPRQSEADQLVALKGLEKEADMFRLNAITAAQRNHASAADAARAAYSERDASSAQVAAIRAAAQARADETLANNNPLIANLAAAIVARGQAI